MSAVPLLTVGAIPWFKSPQQLARIAAAISAIVALFPTIGAKLGLSTPGSVETVVSTTAAFLTVAIPVIASVMKMFDKVQPLTSTQAAADVHPATLAVKAALTQAVPVAAEALPVNPSKPWGK